ncbi:BnaC07g48720D [Brassica napus]|uniref:(rape) hypothetical protein n=1 Tax=Brassica napus TaxID=3708 RepID=A0A078J494_BRANA|nr:unnamed protein product [Brassica napus]CDY57508.1 BnaC07g48720D [Brassica napus]
MPHWRTALKLLEKHGMKLVLLALQVQVEECPTSYRNGAKPSLANSIDKEGQQIVPMLTNMWKRIQNGYAAGGVNNLFELREIDQRVERLEYVGVMELASDVQYMLRGAMQFYGFSHEVRSEARKVHNLLFDLLKMSFPDTDFREARNALSFSGPTPSLVSTSSPRGAGISQGKRPKPVDEGEPHHDDNAVDARRRHAKHHRHSEVVTSSDSEEEKGGRRRG